MILLSYTYSEREGNSMELSKQHWWAYGSVSTNFPDDLTITL